MGGPQWSHQRKVGPLPMKTTTIFPPTGRGGPEVGLEGGDSGRASCSWNPSARPLLPPGRPRPRWERGTGEGEGEACGNSSRVP